MNAVSVNSIDAIAHYMSRVQVGLKHFDPATRQEILSEIEGHLSERIEELQRGGSSAPVEDALLALGDPDVLAQQFSEVSLQQNASRSFLPWVLLRAAARMAILGARGLLAFFMGLVGYVTAVAFFIAAFGKLLMPGKFGFWVGPHGVAWGALQNTNGERELAGQSFIYISLIAAFLVGSATTMLLRWLVRPSGFMANILQRLR
jgi:uncharacterized membrane protein